MILGTFGSDIGARFSRARDIREEALVRLRVFATGEGAYAFQVAEVGGKARLAATTAAGEPAAQSMARLTAFDSTHLDNVLGTLRNPKTAAERGFVEWDRVLPDDHPQKHSFNREVWKASGIRDLTQLLVYDGPRLVAVVGALRTTSMFSPQERRGLTASFIEPIQNAMIAADRVERERLPIGEESLLLSTAGEIELSADDSREWLAVPGLEARLGEVARSLHAAGARRGAIAHGPIQVRMSRLAGADGRTAYLARLQPLDALERAEDSVLTPVQREVARLAAAGTTISEIAEQLSRGTETVRSHLSEVYRRLNVSSRIELSRALASEGVVPAASSQAELTVW